MRRSMLRFVAVTVLVAASVGPVAAATHLPAIPGGGAATSLWQVALAPLTRLWRAVIQALPDLGAANGEAHGGVMRPVVPSEGATPDPNGPGGPQQDGGATTDPNG
jgi:hypothetical protein